MLILFMQILIFCPLWIFAFITMLKYCIVIFALIVESSRQTLKLQPRDACLVCFLPFLDSLGVFLISQISVNTQLRPPQPALRVCTFINKYCSGLTTRKISSHSTDHYFEKLLCVRQWVRHQGYEYKYSDTVLGLRSRGCCKQNTL